MLLSGNILVKWRWAILRLAIEPHFDPIDKGDGGIRRVVEAQRKYLPSYGIDVVEDREAADVLAYHAGLYYPTTKPVVSHCHGLYWEEYEWQNWCYDLNKDVINALLRADITTAPSEWVADVLRHNMWLNPIVLYHGVDLSEWAPGTNYDYVLWNKTRIDPVCDVNPLIDLARKLPNQRFVSTFATEEPNIKTTGLLSHEQAKVIIANAGYYLCTPRETFGIGTLEAMACGVPVIGWLWGGQREIIQHKYNGYLVTPGDTDALVEGLAYCRAHRQELSANARETVEQRFQWSHVMQRYAETYGFAAAPRAGARVSVVIPCYNMQQYMRDTVDSVLNQPVDEIILVDDASTDNTRFLCDEYAAKDARVKVIHNETNQYLAGALNTGIAASKGRYIIPLDADNMLAPNAIQNLADWLDTHGESDIVYGAMEVLEPDGRRWVSEWPPVMFDYRMQMMHRNQITSTSMYRRKVWERSGGYRTRCHTAEDAEFWCRATSLGFRPTKISDAPFFIYRNRTDSMSHQQPDWAWHEWFPHHRIPMANDPMHVSTNEPCAISVIIPVGPGHNPIDAIDSIWAQTFDRWEVIVVNDSDSDYWTPPFVRRFTTDTPGSGPAVARNIGIEHAKGKYVLFLDADDYLQPKALELMYQAVDGRTDLYSYCDWYIAETGEVHETYDYDCSIVLREMGHSVTMLVPRSAIRFDTRLDAWEDWDFCLQLAEKGICGVRVPVALLNYRIRSGGRREQLYARMEELKVNIFNKWRKYMVGEETLMACGCSSGGVVQNVGMPLGPSSIVAQQNLSDSVLIDYIPQSAGTRSFTGKSTGTQYRFGDDPDHRTRYVHKDDAPHLLGLGYFEMHRERNESQLVAAGPPNR